MLLYCKKCGRIVFSLDQNKTCDCCGQIVYPIPKEYRGKGSYTTYQNDLWDKYVKTSPEFDPDLFEHRDEILAKQTAKYEATMAHGKAILEGKDKGNKVSVECPYCHSTNTKKISTFSKVWSMHWLGMYSIGSIAKEWHCNNCNSDF